MTTTQGDNMSIMANAGAFGCDWADCCTGAYTVIHVQSMVCRTPCVPAYAMLGLLQQVVEVSHRFVVLVHALAFHGLTEP